MKWQKQVKCDEGAMALVVAVLIATVLFGVVAIVVDAGSLYLTKRNLQTTADAAALAGVQDLPSNKSAAQQSALYYLQQNIAEELQQAPQIDIYKTSQDNDTIKVTVVGKAPFSFAQIWNKQSAPVQAVAIARVASPAGYSRHVMPFGIMSSEPSGTAPFGYTFGQQVTLKRPAGKGEHGNYQFLSLTDPAGGHVGAKDITDALSSGGVNVPVYIGELYNTKTGMNGKQVWTSLKSWIGSDSHTINQVTRQNADGTVDILDWTCPRLIICPIIVSPGPPVSYNWEDIAGTSRPVQVIGFAFFFIDKIDADKTTGNECWITGRFVRPVNPEDATSWGPIDPYGGISFKLVQ